MLQNIPEIPKTASEEPSAEEIAALKKRSKVFSADTPVSEIVDYSLNDLNFQ
jgi:hypothetical protein